MIEVHNKLSKGIPIYPKNVLKWWPYEEIGCRFHHIRSGNHGDEITEEQLECYMCSCTFFVKAELEYHCGAYHIEHF